MSNIDQLQSWLWVMLALGLGATVGFEREWRGHEAGIRTTALVCAGAAIFGQVSLTTGESRIAAAVVQGIGFIGAGVMFQRGDNVKGVTTAATIWLVAGIGILVSYELWLTAVLTTVTAVAMLEMAPLADVVFRHSRKQPRRREARGSAAETPPDGGQR